MARGFTLLEMLVVLVILGLVAGLVLTHGPPRSATLELRGSAGQVAQALRLARSQAIAGDRPTAFVLDLAAPSWRIGGGAAHPLSPRLAIAMTSVAGEVGRRIAAITFAPDGSSSGGRVALAEGSRRVVVGVDWLTGRVSIAE